MNDGGCHALTEIGAVFIPMLSDRVIRKSWRRPAKQALRKNKRRELGHINAGQVNRTGRLDKTHLNTDNILIVDQNSIPLKDALRQASVYATFLEDVAPSLIEEAEAVWRPEALRLKKEALLRGVSEDDLPLQHDHWDWKAKKQKSASGSRFFGLFHEGTMQGMMNLSPKQPCQLAEQFGKELVYIDYIEIAPWNLLHLAEIPQYRGIGSFFLEAAIQLSQETGTEGRIGLHSLEQSEQFYYNCGMIDCGLQKIGYSLYNYRYFEMTPLQARSFVEG